MHKIFKFCGKYIKEKRGYLALYICVCVLVSVAALVLPYITGNFIDNLVYAKGREFIYRYIIMIVALGVLEIALGFISDRLYNKLQISMAYRMNADAIAHVQRLSPIYIASKDTASLNERINNDSNLLIMFCMNMLHQIVANMILLIAPLVLIFSFNIYLGIALLLLNGAYYGSYILFKKPLFKANYEVSEAQAEFFGKLDAQLSNVRFIQTQGANRSFVKKLDAPFERVLAHVLNLQKVEYAFTGTDKLILALATAIAYLIGGVAVLEEQLTIGRFAIIVSYFAMTMGATRYFFMLGQDVQEVSVFKKRMEEIFSCGEATNGAQTLASISAITAENLSFAYGEAQVLKGFSYEFTRGRAYALTGENGSGKSTLTRVLLGLYIDEYEGEVRYNGVPIQKLDMIALRGARIGVAEQEPPLLPETLRYNITFHDGADVSDDKLMELFKMLGAEEFVTSLENGFDTVISEGASNLSGGEKQRIALVRIMLRDPDVIFLDEPTSALDTEGKKRLMAYLDSVRKSKLIIISTHDDEIAKWCDERLNISLERN